MTAFSSPEFELLEKLHDNRQTRVYRARRIDDGRAVILKILGDDHPQPESLPRHRREYQLLQQLEQAGGVIKALDLIDINGSLTIITEDIGAESLDRILKQTNLSLQQSLELAIAIARALSEIHRAQIIHKDINPANVVWNRTNGDVRIIDFGIASQLAQETQGFLNPGQLEGTLAYTAPEQTGRINRPLDYRADLYSLGVTLYELFAGTRPFTDREGIELIHAHIALPAIPPHQVHPRVPPMVSRIIMRLIEKVADDRYQSADGVLHDLQLCLSAHRSLGSIPEFLLSEGDAPTHFQLPQKLYGRSEEAAAILAACANASEGQASLLLVLGPPGVGKSALVREVYKPLTERQGNFILGKFDQYQRDVPFSAWTQAFQELCNLLLQEDEVVLGRWRERILGSIGTLGRVLTDVIPSIELIIGPQPEVPQLDGDKAQNRLNYIFGNFIKAICQPEHPLVVFIDDWQWADAGSLALLRFILSGGAEHLLLIGAYRDSEVDSTHPLHAALADVARSGCPIESIKLDNLRPEHVAQLVDDTLGEHAECAGLADLLYTKTHGNAFFLTQLLTDLHESGALHFNRNKRRWQCDREKIQEAEISGNVIDLMAKRIRNLPTSTQHAILKAACLSDRFRLGTLARLLGEPPYIVANYLEPALHEGILLPIGSAYRYAQQKDNRSPVHYRFVHDRVRQAAYSLISQAEREETHFKVAEIWLHGKQDKDREYSIFDIANQYNAGRRLIRDATGRGELRQINILAGEKARQAADQATALTYFRQALDLREEGCWQDCREETEALLLAAADCALLCKDYPLMEQWLDEYLAQVDEVFSVVAASKIRLQGYVVQNRLEEAVAVGLVALRLLGCQLDRKPGKLRNLVKLLQTRLAIRSKSFTDLHALPAMTDRRQLETMELLGLLLPPAYWTNPDLLAQVVFQMVRDTLTHGYSPNAGYGLSWWGITESALLDNIDSGVVFGDFAIELSKKHGLRLQQPLFFVGWIVLKYKHHLRKTLPLLQQAYAISLEKGDFEYASYARNNEMQARFHCGTALVELLPEMANAQRDLTRFQLGSSLYWNAIWWQTALNFATPSDKSNVLSGTAYDERNEMPKHLAANDNSTLFLLYCAKTLLSVYFGQSHKAEDYAHEARIRLNAGTGMYAQTLFHFLESLLLTQSKQANETAILQKVAANQKKLARWAEHAPSNHRHQWLLVEAERLRLGGRFEEALLHYEEAIDLARENGFQHEEALALELTAAFHRSRKRSRLAAHYLRQAIQTYEAWGAKAKVIQLRKQYPMELLGFSQNDQRASTETHLSFRSTLHGSESFDLEAASEASLAISGEIMLPALTRTLLHIAIKNSGAQRAALILQQHGEFELAAVGSAEHENEVNLLAQPLDAHAELPVPKTLIQYVARTQKSMVIDDARNRSVFSRDPYFLRERPISILCEPIVRQGKLLGMLYLENNLTVGTFGANRLTLLRLLAAQAAISIENAQLYSGLEEKVEERTHELRDSLSAQEQLNSELQSAYAKLHAANRKLEELANTDGLTGLANRRHLAERLAYEIGRCARDGQALSLLICDLDNFKHYNDLYGHVSGDDCLRAVACEIRKVFARSSDLVARYGGEEFIVLLPGIESGEAQFLAERMRQNVLTLAIPHAGNAGHGVATISVGCHTRQVKPESTLSDVIENADRALYAAKAQGRNCVVANGDAPVPPLTVSDAEPMLP